MNPTYYSVVFQAEPFQAGKSSRVVAGWQGQLYGRLGTAGVPQASVVTIDTGSRWT